MLNKVFRDFNGIATVEYALLAALVAVVCITSMTNLGQSVSNRFHNAAVDLEDEENNEEESGSESGIDGSSS